MKGSVANWTKSVRKVWGYRFDIYTERNGAERYIYKKHGEESEEEAQTQKSLKSTQHTAYHIYKSITQPHRRRSGLHEE